MKRNLLVLISLSAMLVSFNAFADEPAKPSMLQQAQNDSATLPSADKFEQGGATTVIVIDKSARAVGSGIKSGAQGVEGGVVVVFDATGKEIKKGADAADEYAKSVNSRAAQLPNSDKFERGSLMPIIAMDDAGRGIGNMFKKFGQSIRHGVVDLGEGTKEVFDDSKGSVKKHFTNTKSGTEAFLVVKKDGTEEWILKAKTGTKNFFHKVGHFFSVAAHPYAKQKAPCDIPKEVVAAPEGNQDGAESDQKDKIELEHSTSGAPSDTRVPRGVSIAQ